MCIQETIRDLSDRLQESGILFEIIAVDDGSTDGTWDAILELGRGLASLRPVRNPGPHGIGRAIQLGLRHMQGDAVVIVMADGSDDPDDIVTYWVKLQEGYECVFGSRFIRGGKVEGYPLIKLVLNRAANLFIRILFGIGLNDTTNAFKAYRRTVIEGVGPILSPHFNILVELPLKAIVRGYTWCVVPIGWTNRKAGVSKLKIKEMGSRYFFICAYVWLEKYFSKGDYLRGRNGSPRLDPGAERAGSEVAAERLRNTAS